MRRRKNKLGGTLLSLLLRDSTSALYTRSLCGVPLSRTPFFSVRSVLGSATAQLVGSASAGNRATVPHADVVFWHRSSRRAFLSFFFFITFDDRRTYAEQPLARWRIRCFQLCSMLQRPCLAVGLPIGSTTEIGRLVSSHGVKRLCSKYASKITRVS